MAYKLDMHHDLIGRPMSTSHYARSAELDMDDHPNCPGGCIRDGFRVFEIYSGICSDTESTFHMIVELRVKRKLSTKAPSDMDKTHEIDCATYLELNVLSWVERMANQLHSEAHGSISHDKKEFSMDFDIVVTRKNISDNNETKNKEKECYMHMISSIHKLVWATQFH